MPDLLLPGTPDFELPELILSNRGMPLFQGERLALNALNTIKVLWTALRVLHAANAKDVWPCYTGEAWESEELTQIRKALEKEAT